MREEQKKIRRQQILNTGLSLFVTKGYAATKISDIATASNMSMGLMFHYFKNSEELYIELVKMGVDATKNIIHLNYQNALDFLFQFADFLLHEVKESSFTAQMFLLLHLSQNSLDTPQPIQELLKQITTLQDITKIIEIGQKEGSMKPGDPQALASAFLCCISGIAQQQVNHKSIPLPEANWIVDIVKKEGKQS